MNLLMVSGDRSLLAGKQGAFYAMLSEFHKHWGRIDILCPRAGDAVMKTFFGNVHVHSNSGSLWSHPRWIVEKGSELIAAYQHAVITAHEYPPFYNGRGALRLSAKTDVPVVLEVHHVVGWPKSASLTECIGRMLSKIFLPSEARKAAGVRVVNSTIGDLLVQWGIDKQKVHLVPSFYLDKDLLKPRDTAKKYDIAFCARLVPNKGLFELLKAVRNISDATLIVIGDGSLKAAGESFAQSLGIANRVTFTGWLKTPADVIAAMQSAKIFVMNSRSEGGPRVALEAMVCGLPVVATRVGVMPDVIRHSENGMLVDGSVTSLQTAIGQLLADEQLRERLGNSATKIIEQFEKDKALANYANFLKSMTR